MKAPDRKGSAAPAGTRSEAEVIASRQNRRLQVFRQLARDAQFRREAGLFVCDGEKLLQEALRSGAEVDTVLWREARPEYPAFPHEALLSAELFDYVSPMKNSPGPLFTVRMPETDPGLTVDQRPAADRRPVADGETHSVPSHVLVLEGVQDPGNVGTVLRTADAFGMDCIILLEGCADVYAPKTVRATMGAIFRQKVLQMTREELAVFCAANGLKLYAAALSDRAADVRETSLHHAAVCVGSEGRGLSPELRALCAGEVIVPMRGAAESLNAAVASAILMWEMVR